MSAKQKTLLFRIIAASCITAVLTALPITGYLRFVLYLVPYLFVGWDVLLEAFYGIINGRMFDENFLMAIATVGAFALGALQSGDYLEAVAVMLLYQTGELFQGYAVGRTRKNIIGLMDIRPEYANLEADGKTISAAPEDVAVGSVIVVKPGEKIPIDCRIIEGESELNTAALTGESVPKRVSPGDEVISGCVNITGVLRAETVKAYGESAVSRILELVENASSRKSQSERFISRFAKVYTPAVCAAALLLTAAPPIANVLLFSREADFTVWLYRALSFLVASCPCALVISIPLSFFASIGGASRDGILIKGSSYLEALWGAETVVFDKTGTLTRGEFKVTKVKSIGFTEEQLLEYAAHAESATSHPIGKSIILAYGKVPDCGKVHDIRELGGKGVTATVGGTAVAVGNKKLMEELGLSINQVGDYGTVAHVAIGGAYAGYIVISDSLKTGAAEALVQLRRVGIKKTVMLTGDSRRAAEHIAGVIGVDTVHSELLPDGKVEKAEELLREGRGGSLVYVGDGINDAPVLARADVGIAMGALGSDAAIEAADIVLMDDDPLKLVKTVKIAKRCRKVVLENTVFAISVKLIALALVATGNAGMWLSVLADVGVTVIAILNSVRLLRTRR